MSLTRQTWSLCALQAAVQLDLFTPLDSETVSGLSLEDLAEAINCDPRAAGMLATALVSLGLLKRNDSLLELTEAARELFSKKSPEYFGYMLDHQSHILPNWLRLSEAVKSGQRTASGSAADSNWDDHQRDAFLLAMFNNARLQAQTVSEALDLSDRTRLLDLGGGPGTYAAQFCLQYPHLQAAVFDLPGSERAARTVLSRLGMADRIAFFPGDYKTVPLPQGFDAVWISQVLHQESPAEAAALMKKAVQALPGGGLLAVQEFLINDELDGPEPSALFALNMLVNTEGGQAYTFKEMTSIMTEAGLTQITVVPARLPPGCTLMTGRKP
jgi:SAM-dependent methyltransferase